MPNAETVGEIAHVFTDDHPARTDSAAYRKARKLLMNQRRGGCMACGGTPDMTHPELLAVANSKGLEDHHGGGLYVKDVLVALNLFPLEWSQGWGADPAVVAQLVANLNVVLAGLGEPTYDDPIVTTADVMAYTDSPWNASVKLCKPHHVGTQHQHTPDAAGHEAVGIHEIPAPIWFGQMTCDWARFDMWGGTTGTIAVAPAHQGRKLLPGQVVVHHVDESVHPGVKRGHVLGAHHPVARLAHTGAHVDRSAA